MTVFSFLNLLVFLVSLYQCRIRRNNLGMTYLLLPLGVFVWADGVVFGMFWFLVGMVTFFLNDWVLLLLIYAVFWVVRSLGETIYYFNQQFSEVKRMPGKALPGYKIFDDEYTIWFVYQIMAQCVTVISIIASVYLFKVWLG